MPPPRSTALVGGPCASNVGADCILSKSEIKGCARQPQTRLDTFPKSLVISRERPVSRLMLRH